MTISLNLRLQRLGSPVFANHFYLDNVYTLSIEIHEKLLINKFKEVMK